MGVCGVCGKVAEVRSQKSEVRESEVTRQNAYWHPLTFPWRQYLLVVVFFALGLLSKPMLVTLPLVLLLLDYWPLEWTG